MNTRPVRKTWLTVAIALCAGGFTGACDDGGTATTRASAADSTPTPTTAAVATTVATAVEPLPMLFAGSNGVRDSGTYAIGKFSALLRISIPEGWSTLGDFALIAPGGPDAGYLAFWKVDDVNLDACRWQGTVGIGPSADDLVGALVRQTSTATTGPVAVTVDGHDAHELMFSVEPDLEFASCDDSTVSPWFEADGDSRFYTAPGDREMLRIVDLGVDAALINYRVPSDVPAAIGADVEAMLASIQVG